MIVLILIFTIILLLFWVLRLKSDIIKEKETEKNSIYCEDRFKVLFDIAPIFIDTFDKDGRCLLWNKECEKIFGWSIDELNSHENSFSLFYPNPKDQEGMIEAFANRKGTEYIEMSPLTKNGELIPSRWVNVNLPNNEIIYIGIDMRDQKKSEIKRLEETIKERTQTLQVELKNNKLLLKELHHRVKNNMQFITSLYALKLDTNTDSKLHEKLRDVERKIYAMSKAHEMLYTQKNLDNIDAKSYFEKVLNSIKSAFLMEHIFIQLSVETTLKSEEAIYCELIVNELVTNAVKHAFDKKGGRIEIELHPHGEHTLLRVCDDGKGITKSGIETFGTMMVRTLAEEQLEGKLTINSEKGVKISIIF